MSSKAVVAGINGQISKEFYAAYVYLSMASYFELENLPGFAHWMRVQHQEEMVHAMRLFDYLIEQGVRVKLQAIEKPPSKFDTPLAVMEAALAHEQGVTGEIHQLYELAIKEKDYPAQLQLQWFITEQTEEEKTVGDIIARMKRAGDGGAAMLMIDRELGARPAG